MSSGSPSYNPSCPRARARALRVIRHKKFTQIIWTKLPVSWRREKDFVIEVIRSCPLNELPNVTELLRTSSTHSDRDVFLVLSQRSDFARVYFDENLLVSSSFRDDKELMLVWCSKVPQTLQDCSERLCDDNDIVRAAVATAGSTLQYASLRLQQHKEMVVLACQSSSSAFELCPPDCQTYRDLVQDRNFFLNVLLVKPGDGQMLRFAAPHLQEDPELVLKALEHGLSFEDYVGKATSVDFIQLALQRNPHFYLQMDREIIQRHPSFLRKAISTPADTMEMQLKILNRGREWLFDVLESKTATEPPQGIIFRGKNLTMPFYDDRDAMLSAISRDYRFYNVASQRLRESPDIIMAAISRASAEQVFMNVPHWIKVSHPEISIKAIQLWEPRYLQDLPANIPTELWSHRDVCIALVRRGWVVEETWFVLYLHSDIAVGLELARCNWRCIASVGVSLLSDRNFVIQALNIDGRVFNFIADSLKKDFEILLIAVANYHNNRLQNHVHGRFGYNSIVNFFNAASSAGIKTLNDFKDEITRQLELRDAFVLDILPGMSIPRPQLILSLSTPLRMLDQGMETSNAYRVLIAEYLGLPTGTRLTLLMKAQANMAEMQSDPSCVVETKSITKLEMEA